MLLFPAVLAHWVLFLSLLLLGPFQALVLAITYKSRIVFPFHLLFGFPVVGPFLLKMGLNVCVCVCGPKILDKVLGQAPNLFVFYGYEISYNEKTS